MTNTITSVRTDDAVSMISCQVLDQSRIGPAASQAITKAIAVMQAPARPTCRSHQRANVTVVVLVRHSDQILAVAEGPIARRSALMMQTAANARSEAQSGGG